MTIAIASGIAVHASSSSSAPWTGTPTSDSRLRRNLTAKTITSVTTSVAKKAVTPRMKK